jgi:hypothetical protein
MGNSRDSKAVFVLPTLNPLSTSNPSAPRFGPRVWRGREIVGGCGVANQPGFAVSFAFIICSTVAKRNRRFQSLSYMSLWVTISRSPIPTGLSEWNEAKSTVGIRIPPICGGNYFGYFSRFSDPALSEIRESGTLSERKQHLRTDHLRNRTSR